MRRKLVFIVAGALLLALSTFGTPAFADSGHGRPSCEGQLDELGYGTRDGWDHFHRGSAAVFGSLADVEGYLVACRTNDATVVEAVAGAGRVIRVSGVVRAQVRALLQQWKDPDGAGPLPKAWVTVKSSDSVNTGVNRTLTVTTPFVNEVGSTPAFEHTWTRVVVRVLLRYSNGGLQFQAHPTYAVWVGDGPVSPAIPPS